MLGTDTPETPADRFRRRTAGLVQTLADVPDDRWDAPSACDEWTVRQLAGHVVDSQQIFATFVGVELVAGPSLDDDPAGAVVAALAQTQALLDDPAVAGTEFDGMMGRTSYGEAVDRFASIDLVLHRWDAGWGAGVPVELDDEDVDAVLRGIDSLPAELLAMYRSPGVFGPELEAPEGADAQTRMLAFAGRRAW
jgi:uncharacterized protein (TIGR03086 family)